MAYSDLKLKHEGVLKEFLFWKAKYAARDKFDRFTVYGYYNKPKKLLGQWNGNLACMISACDTSFLKWEDKEPINIEKALKIIERMKGEKND